MKSGAFTAEFYSERLDFAGMLAAWEASALPLSYTREAFGNVREIATPRQSVLQRFYLDVGVTFPARAPPPRHMEKRDG